MATVHFVLQGKGGVGKSFVSAILAQYLRRDNTKVHCADTDPINATFSNFEEFSVTHIDLLIEDSNTIAESEFDNLIELICSANEESHVVIDNGASSFLPLVNYITENNALDLLKSLGHKVYLHSILTGGQALNDTLAGLELLATQFSKCASICVWKNEFFGEIKADGKQFEQMNTYKKHQKDIVAMVVIRKQPDLFLMSLKMAFVKNLSFEAALAHPEFKIMDKQRLRMIQKDLFTQLDHYFYKNNEAV